MPPRKSKRKKDESDDEDFDGDVIKTTSSKRKKEKKAKEVEQVDWSNVDITATIKRFHELDDQIIKLEEERQEALKILKSHPQTLVQYSAVTRYEKTKESFRTSSFYNLGSDCLTLIFDFCFARQVVEVPFVMKLFGMTTKIREALLHSNFILGIANPNYKFNIKAMPIFVGLHGLEVVMNSASTTVANHLLKNGSRFSHLIARDDIFVDKFTITEEMKSKLKSVQQIGSHGKGRCGFEELALEHYSTLAFGKVPQIPKCKSVIISGPTTDPSWYHLDLKTPEDIIVLLCPNCRSSRSTFNETTLFHGRITAKYLVSVRFISKSKKPDLTAKAAFYAKIFEKIEGMDDSAGESRYPEVTTIHFSSTYREAFEKLEGIQHYTKDSKDIIGFLKKQFNE